MEGKDQGFISHHDSIGWRSCGEIFTLGRYWESHVRKSSHQGPFGKVMWGSLHIRALLGRSCGEVFESGPYWGDHVEKSLHQGSIGWRSCGKVFESGSMGVMLKGRVGIWLRLSAMV